jgi:hypothetical protein
MHLEGLIKRLQRPSQEITGSYVLVTKLNDKDPNLDTAVKKN